MKQVLSLFVFCSLIGVMYQPIISQAQEIDLTAVVDNVMQATQKVYQAEVIDKLQGEGTGASAHYVTQKGFVPPLEIFMRRMGFDTIAIYKREGKQPFRFSFSPRGQGKLSVKLKESSLSAEKHAAVVARVLDVMVRAIRGTYTMTVVRKLKSDGMGASIDYRSKTGFAPLPAVFLRLIATDVVARSNNQFSVSLRSRWHLNPQQGLQDEFERSGWNFLAKQQEEKQGRGESLQSFVWKPYVQVVSKRGKDMLRYLSADAGVSGACITCHNNWEQRENVQAMRKKGGVESGKTFEQFELMGALSILVSLD